MYSCETKTIWNFMGVIKKKLRGISRVPRKGKVKT